MIQVTINGEPRQIEEGIYVRDLLSRMQLDPQFRGIAVAVNGDILLREQYGLQLLKEGDALELVQMTAGG